MTFVFRNRLDNDTGRQIFPPVPPVIVTTITTVTQLKAALLVAGNYEVAAGNYVGTLTAAVDDVSIHCLPGTIFTAAANTDAAWTVLANNFSLTGDWQLNAGIHTAMTIGDQLITTDAALPHDVLIEGGTILAQPLPAGGARGIACHGVNITFSNCRVEGFALPTQEAQAFWCCNTNGPITITDCFLEGAGEVLLSGGSTISIPNAVPSDVYIARCTFYKRPSWRPPTAVTVKNNFEMKNGQRWLIEDNVFDGSWADAQIGVGIVFTVRQSQSNQIWAIVDDITFNHNIVRNCYASGAFAVTILGHEDQGRLSEQTRTMRFTNNLFEDSTGGIQVNSGVTDLLLIDHNTFAGDISGEIIQFVNSFTLSVVQFTKNAANEGAYGVWVAGVTTGNVANELNAACGTGNWTCTGNILGRNQTQNPTWPAGNTVIGPASTMLALTPPPDCQLTGAQAGADAGWSGPAGVGLDGDGTSTGPP